MAQRVSFSCDIIFFAERFQQVACFGLLTYHLLNAGIWAKLKPCYGGTHPAAHEHCLNAGFWATLKRMAEERRKEKKKYRENLL